MFIKEKWFKLSFYDQLRYIAAEVKRADLLQKNNKNYLTAIERAIELVDLSLSDSRWRDNALMFLKLRDELCRAYLRETDPSKIYEIL